LFELEVQPHVIAVNGRFFVSFQRAQCLTDHQVPHLPPSSLGALPVYRIREEMPSVPRDRLESVGILVPIVPGEAFWLGLRGSAWSPNAVKVEIGGQDAISGLSWREGLHEDPQNYVVCPAQLSVDGIYSKGGIVRQFVPVTNVKESENLAKTNASKMRIEVFNPRDSRSGVESQTFAHLQPEALHSGERVEIRGGSQISQKITTDPHGLEFWDQAKSLSIFVQWVDPQQYRLITGKESPAPASENACYKGYRLP
jgi:hypothetical protein